ncbi:MAG: UpxY family transcription antiterminator [Bacteroidales bacterium]
MQKKWYVVYTKSRQEKMAVRFLQEEGIECYLPLQKKLRQWKDRRKWVEIPLMNSYVFVRISNDKEYLDVLKTENVVAFITFEGKAAVVPDHQIKAIKLLLAAEAELEVTTQKLEAGDQIEVKAGPLKGLIGEVITHKNKRKVKVQIEHLGQAIIVDIGVKYLNKARRLAEKQ